MSVLIILRSSPASGFLTDIRVYLAKIQILLRRSKKYPVVSSLKHKTDSTRNRKRKTYPPTLLRCSKKKSSTFTLLKQKTLRLKQKESYRDSFKLCFAAGKTSAFDSLKQRKVLIKKEGELPETRRSRWRRLQLGRWLYAAHAEAICSTGDAAESSRWCPLQIGRWPVAAHAKVVCSTCSAALQLSAALLAAQTMASCSSGRGSLQLPVAPSSTSSRTIYPCRHRKHGSPQSEAPVVAGSGQGRRKVWQ